MPTFVVLVGMNVSLRQIRSGNIWLDMRLESLMSITCTRTVTLLLKISCSVCCLVIYTTQILTEVSVLGIEEDIRIAVIECQSSEDQEVDCEVEFLEHTDLSLNPWGCWSREEAEDVSIRLERCISSIPGTC
jgi:hypothetical protein